MRNLKLLKNQVEFCLAKYPDSRNCDIKLTNAVWFEYYRQYLFTAEDGTLAIKLSDTYKLPKQDNVKRIRAKIQNEEHRFLPTSYEVAKKRGWAEENWRKHLGYNPELRKAY